MTGPGLTRYMDVSGNVLILIDEFDGEHQKMSIFGTDTKSGNVKWETLIFPSKFRKPSLFT